MTQIESLHLDAGGYEMRMAVGEARYYVFALEVFLGKIFGERNVRHEPCFDLAVDNYQTTRRGFLLLKINAVGILKQNLPVKMRTCQINPPRWVLLDKSSIANGV